VEVKIMKSKCDIPQTFLLDPILMKMSSYIFSKIGLAIKAMNRITNPPPIIPMYAKTSSIVYILITISL
jgi:hypothetical protein